MRYLQFSVTMLRSTTKNPPYMIIYWITILYYRFWKNSYWFLTVMIHHWWWKSLVSLDKNLKNFVPAARKLYTEDQCSGFKLLNNHKADEHKKNRWRSGLTDVQVDDLDDQHTICPHHEAIYLSRWQYEYIRQQRVHSHSDVVGLQLPSEKFSTNRLPGTVF